MKSSLIFTSFINKELRPLDDWFKQYLFHNNKHVTSQQIEVYEIKHITMNWIQKKVSDFFLKLFLKLGVCKLFNVQSVLNYCKLKCNIKCMNT